ncbi:uncharacterized protein LOC120106307 [Phoenix dactylifera]|uniref:Uncharacterized protein LOC120106307 n=1 Tax=Phoenix dactylifera TaxID=42345 RepID=A0A8B8ZPF6_PHODC|nr:uncharacterized protein LOC120106307 [Phoenix dactylifera]
MVGRIKPLLPGIISQEQGAFVAGRNISHNVMLAQEMMWDLQRASKRRSLMVVKLDMERAYDRIRWSFLRRALEAYGFHRRWIGWGAWRGFSDAWVLRRVLAGYCAASGQRVNFMKSAIQFSPSTETRVILEIRRILQIPEQEGTLVYLGVPITGRRLRVTECSGLVRRVESRLEGWRASSLSMMERLTLVRLVLGSMPIYLMANTVVPKTTLLKIERLLRSFLWGSHGGGHGVHLVAWEQVCLSISEGGLEVQSLLERREALIARHAARFLLEPQGLWSRVMAARYGRGGSE